MQLGTKRRRITVLGNVTPLERFKVIVFLQVDHRRNTTTGLVCNLHPRLRLKNVNAHKKDNFADEMPGLSVFCSIV